MKKLMILLFVVAIVSACSARKNDKEADDKTENSSIVAKENSTPEYITTASGLQYKILRDADGSKPGPTSRVTVNYEGKLLDGTIFDSSYDRGKPNTFGLNEVIPGWTEGVQLMSVGSMYEFIIPPALAYGSRELPGIPANSTLKFKVELLEIK